MFLRSSQVEDHDQPKAKAREVMSKKKNPRRVTLDLGESAILRIERMMGKLDTRTIVGIMLKGLQVLEYLTIKTEEGNDFQFKNKKTGEVVQVAILELVPMAPEYARNADTLLSDIKTRLAEDPAFRVSFAALLEEELREGVSGRERGKVEAMHGSRSN